MKTMSCKQLGGACDMQFHADSFEEMAEQSKNHGTEMLVAGDEAHLAAMNEMKALMNDPNAMSDWFQEKRELFESLSVDK